MIETFRFQCESDEGHDKPYTKWKADVHIDEQEGRISVHSTYGDYSDSWPSFDARGKRSLKSFLSRCDRGYIMENFCGGHPKWFDKQKTLKELRLMVLAARRGRRKWHAYADDVRLDKDQATDCWDHIKRLESDDFETADQYWREVFQNGALGEHFFQDPHGIICYTDYEPRLRKFMDLVWPHIREALKGAALGEHYGQSGKTIKETLAP